MFVNADGGAEAVLGNQVLGRPSAQFVPYRSVEKSIFFSITMMFVDNMMNFSCFTKQFYTHRIDKIHTL